MWGRLQESPLPPLNITLSSHTAVTLATTQIPATLSTTSPSVSIDVPPPHETSLPSIATAKVDPTKAEAASEAPVPESASPLAPIGGNAKQVPNEPPTTPPLGTLPPLAMCTLRLEAVGLPPRTVEIAPDEAEAMRLEEFMGLLAAHFEGRSVAGAPAIGVAPEAVTGLVDSAESLHSVLRASLAHPMVLQVPLLPLPPPSCPKKLLALAARLAAPVDTLLAHPYRTSRILHDLVCLLGRYRATAEGRALDLAAQLGRAGMVASLARLLTARPDLAATHPGVAVQLLAAISDLAHVPENATAFGRAGVVVPLASMLTAHPDLFAAHPEVALALLAAIASLAKENCAAFKRAGVAAPLVGLLRAQTDPAAIIPEAVLWFCTAVSQLATDPEISAAFLSAGMPALLVGLLSAHPDLPASPELAKALLTVIVNLSQVSPPFSAALGQAGVAASLVRLLAHPNLVAISELLLRSIGCLAEDRANLACFVRAGVMDPLVKLLAHLPITGPGVANQALRVVIRLSADPGCRAVFQVIPLDRFIAFPGVDPKLLRYLGLTA
ncbi:hypothetical protein PAPYR_4502 [Paratrimastix pyriformis]|uniref:Uncharacterized protein n=1 Tax=Paratrimastix pyriformis TaxID=342808 RepID=A0ABQ8UPK5_9EUKA|nr:hypothetical protein PAPYR_4502 [Paratrimastix pyriformis]